jgi:hypothetical protein
MAAKWHTLQIQIQTPTEVSERSAVKVGGEELSN